MKRETEMAHCAKCAEHHGGMSQAHRQLATIHSQIAQRGSDPVLAEHHRDASKCHNTIAEHHDDMRAHFEARREALANGSGADVVDSHEDSGDRLMHAATAHLLDVDGRLDLRKLVSAE
jgi:hypothetical protein